jgi:23S rRNA pseudouridine2604 synthase
MSELGLCSRREADEWIPRGWVLVDGKPVTELGTRIRPEAEIEILQAARSEQGERVTVLLNKPVGYVSGQAEDGYEPAAVLFAPENQWELDPPASASPRGNARISRRLAGSTSTRPGCSC